jgi:hypothetical protein
MSEVPFSFLPQYLFFFSVSDWIISLSVFKFSHLISVH